MSLSQSLTSNKFQKQLMRLQHHFVNANNVGAPLFSLCKWVRSVIWLLLHRWWYLLWHYCGLGWVLIRKGDGGAGFIEAYGYVNLAEAELINIHAVSRYKVKLNNTENEGTEISVQDAAKFDLLVCWCWAQLRWDLKCWRLLRQGLEPTKFYEK